MGATKQKMLEEAHMDGLIEEAAHDLFINGKYSQQYFNKEQRELIEARAEILVEDWNAGSFPGWRE